MKLLIINLMTESHTTMTTPVRPIVGDSLPISYTNERVKEVIYNVGCVKTLLGSDADLIVYTE